MFLKAKNVTIYLNVSSEIFEFIVNDFNFHLRFVFFIYFRKMGDQFLMLRRARVVRRLDPCQQINCKRWLINSRPIISSNNNSSSNSSSSKLNSNNTSKLIINSSSNNSVRAAPRNQYCCRVISVRYPVLVRKSFAR